MTIRQCFYSVKRYGLRGILNYMVNLCKSSKYSHPHLEKTPLDTPLETGITLIGDFANPYSLSKVLRDFAHTLKKTGIPFQAYNTNTNPTIPESEFRDLITPDNEFSLNKYSHVIRMYCDEKIALRDPRCSLHTIAFWEFESGFCEFHPHFLSIPDLVAMSHFNQAVFLKLLPATANVKKILYPFQFDKINPCTPIEIIRKKYGIEGDDFIFFFNFSYMSSYYRKNPEGLLSAFAKAFPNNPKTKILFKTQGAGKAPTQKKALDTHIKNLGLSDRVISIDTFMTQDELISLTNACDVYVSLHRGEGFGLGIAEAMSLGIPTVVTNYSAPTEFCTPDNSCLIPYTLVPVPENQIDIPHYKHVKEWAEPDIDATAKALQRLYNEPSFRVDLGAAAKKFIADYFSTENFKRSVEAFLDADYK